MIISKGIAVNDFGSITVGKFFEVYQPLEDAAHWQTLADDITALFAEAPTYDAGDVMVLDDEVAIMNEAEGFDFFEYMDRMDEVRPFIEHMCAACERGERFIVAKLAFDGGAA